MAKKSRPKHQKPQQPQHPKSKPQHAPQQAKGKNPPKKERGLWLTIVIVIMGLHGIFATILYYTQNTQGNVDKNLILSLMVLHSLANIVAAVGIWYWQRWALYVYAASTVVAVVAGLLSVGIWSVFYMVLPFVIVGWVLRTKWAYFGIKTA